MSAPEPMTTEARVAEMLAGARCQDVHHAAAYVDPWCHACRSWAQTTTRALAPILDAARAERCCDQQDSCGSDLEAIAQRWELPDSRGTMPNVRLQERRKCADDLRAVLSSGESKGCCRRCGLAKAAANVGVLCEPPFGRVHDFRTSAADTCCGKCPGDTCYVDQVTGA